MRRNSHEFTADSTDRIINSTAQGREVLSLVKLSLEGLLQNLKASPSS